MIKRLSKHAVNIILFCFMFFANNYYFHYYLYLKFLSFSNGFLSFCKNINKQNKSIFKLVSTIWFSNFTTKDRKYHYIYINMTEFRRYYKLAFFTYAPEEITKPIKDNAINHKNIMTKKMKYDIILFADTKEQKNEHTQVF